MADLSKMLFFASQCAVPSTQGSRRRVMKKTRQKKWKLVAVTISVMMTMYCDYYIRNPKQMWTFPRSSNWWEDIVLNNFNDHDWMQNFRMSKQSFQYLCDQLKGVLEKQTTRLLESHWLLNNVWPLLHGNI